MSQSSLHIKAPESGVLIFGLSDVASAVAHRLVQAGLPCLLVESNEPTAHRRGMAFADAFWDATTTLAGITCERQQTLEDWWDARGTKPLGLITTEPTLPHPNTPVIVDARMRKRSAPADQRHLGPHVIGLGPGMIAGVNCHLAVETSWTDLGRVIPSGPTLPLAGEPRSIDGYGRDRLVYAPAASRWQTDLQIGALVEPGTLVGYVGITPLHAPIAGILRGLTRSGVGVNAGTKLIEVDPRNTPALAFGLGERPQRIAEGVFAAIQMRLNQIRE